MIRGLGTSTSAILAQCNSGSLAGHFTVKELQHALAVMPAYTKQYTSCPDVVEFTIDRVQRHRGTGVGTGAVGSFLPGPVIVVLAVLVVIALTLAALAVRRRRRGSGAT